MDLFRKVALDHRAKRLYGGVTLHMPPDLTVYTLMSVLALVGAGVFTASASIPRRETVQGWVAPREGLAQIVPPRAGVLRKLFVAEGDNVQAGQPLAVLDFDLSGQNGGLAKREQDQAAVRMAELDLQIDQSVERSGIEVRRMQGRAAALREAEVHLRSQRELVMKALQLARQQQSRLQPLISSGYISTSELDQKAQNVLVQQQSLEEIDRQISATSADVADADAQVRLVPVSAAQEQSQLRSTRATLAQSMAELDVQTSNIVRAPVAGSIAVLDAHAGDAVNPAAPMMIVSTGRGAIEADLLVPTRSAGFIAAGQTVRLMVDAFPYQRFGIVSGSILQVSRASISPGQLTAPISFKEPVYRVIVSIPRTATIWSYGRDRPLRTGMTLRADILTDKRTIVQWLLDPLLSAKRRMAT